MKKNGVEPDSVFSPVCQWSSVRLMLILSLMLGLYTESVDFSNAFIQADLKDDVYVKPPAGFKTPKPNQVLKLNKSVYGSTSAPKIWYEKLDGGLRARGLRSSKIDPCLYVSKNLIVAVFVDDLAIASTHKRYIDEFIASLDKDGDSFNWELTREGNLAEFLGVDILKLPNEKGYKLLQEGLIKKVLSATNMEDCNGKDTPCSGDGKPLGSDKNGPPAQESWNYRSVVGMLMYLAANSRPEIAFATHQVARFSHCPKASHEKAVLHIIKYLKKTPKEGLIYRPSSEFKFELFVDADFAGLYGVEDGTEALSAKSRSGFVICFANCPVAWTSKLISEICLSTAESECVSCAMALRAFLPMKVLGTYIASTFSKVSNLTFIAKSHVWEDNAAVVQLANTKRFSPRTRHIATKYWWFLDKCGTPQNPNGKEIIVTKIDGTINIADIMTKNTKRETFVRLRKLMCGW